MTCVLQAPAPDRQPSEFDVYRFPLSGYSIANPVNRPAPTVVFSDDLSSPDRDSHGMVSTKQGKYVWVSDRAWSVLEVFAVDDSSHAGTIVTAGGVVVQPYTRSRRRRPSQQSRVLLHPGTQSSQRQPSCRSRRQPGTDGDPSGTGRRSWGRKRNCADQQHGRRRRASNPHSIAVLITG